MAKHYGFRPYVMGRLLHVVDVMTTTACSTFEIQLSLLQQPSFFRETPMPETFILIPGRTSEQGCGISEGKFRDKYQRQINTLQVAPGDMDRLGLSEGDRVRLTSEQGQQVEVGVIQSKGDELPEGLLFIAYGDISSQLMGGDTHGSGMPTSKGMDVELEVLR